MAKGDSFPEPGNTRLTIKLGHDRLPFTFSEIARLLTTRLNFPAQKQRKVQKSCASLPSLILLE